MPIHNLLSTGNNVLVVSKPHRESIQAICADALPFRDQLLFRFTIGGLDEAVMGHWEPGAPSFSERFECLKLAFENGYATSVSAEPMLGGKEEAVKLYHLLEPYVTKEIWFGKMNRIGGMKDDPDPAIASHAKLILEQQTDDEIIELVNQLGGLPKIAWKDSIQEVCAKRGRLLDESVADIASDDTLTSDKVVEEPPVTGMDESGQELQEQDKPVPRKKPKVKLNF